MEYQVSGKFIELYFDEIPDETMRNSLKICGWRYRPEKQCWRHFNNVENLQFAKALVEDSTPKEAPKWYENLDTYIFEVDNQILVRTNSFYCNIYHELEDIAGEISVIDKKGNVHVYLVPMAYCESCGLYYMLEETFKELKKYGVIRCQIMTFERYSKDGFFDGNFEKWRDIGPLKLWGYSVNAEDGLSEYQRQAILEDIVDCKAMTKDQVLSYLDFFIRLHRTNDGLYVDKWKADRMHLANYKLGSAKRVIFV